MRAAGVTRGLADAVREGIATFLGIAGLVAIVLGLLYLMADGDLPYVLQGATSTGHHLHRALACLGGGVACAGVAWLIRVRRRT